MLLDALLIITFLSWILSLTLHFGSGLMYMFLTAALIILVIRLVQSRRE